MNGDGDGALPLALSLCIAMAVASISAACPSLLFERLPPALSLLVSCPRPPTLCGRLRLSEERTQEEGLTTENFGLRCCGGWFERLEGRPRPRC